MRVGSGTWAPPRNVGVSARAYQDLKTILHRELITQIDLEKLTTLEDVRARSQVREVIQGLIVKLDTPLSTVERDRLSREVLHEVFGLGPLEPLLQDVTINDILVNTCKQVYVERSGVLGIDQPSYSRTTLTCAILSTRSCPPSAGVSTNRLRCAMPVCWTALVSTSSFLRWRWMGRFCRSAVSARFPLARSS